MILFFRRKGGDFSIFIILFHRIHQNECHEKSTQSPSLLHCLSDTIGQLIALKMVFHKKIFLPDWSQKARSESHCLPPTTPKS
jgi:hypothetical protein